MLRRKKKKKDRPQAQVKPPRPPWPHKAKALKASAVLAAAALAMVALWGMRTSVLASPEHAGKSARVRLAERPVDLPPYAVRSVLSHVQAKVSGRGVFDESLAKDVYDAAAEHPWIAKVRRVRKHHDGTVVIEAEFRRPSALVAVETRPGEFHVVDAAGVVLPLRANQVRQDAFVKIDGVATHPPPPGQKWDAPELNEGLRLLALVKGRAWQGQISVIDVRNHNGRISPMDPHLQFYAQLGQSRRTRILFGRFPAEDGLDYCLAPEAKLVNLDAYVASNGGKLAGVKDWIDLRFEKLHVSIN